MVDPPPPGAGSTVASSVAAGSTGLATQQPLSHGLDFVRAEKRNPRALIGLWAFAPVWGIAVISVAAALAGSWQDALWWPVSCIVLLGLKATSTWQVLTRPHPTHPAATEGGLEKMVAATGLIGQCIMVLTAIAAPFSDFGTLIVNLLWSIFYGLGFVPLSIVERSSVTPASQAVYAVRQYATFLDTASDLSVGVTLVAFHQDDWFELTAGIIILFMGLLQGKLTEISILNVTLDVPQLKRMLLLECVAELPILALTTAVAVRRGTADGLLVIAMTTTLLTILMTLFRLWWTKKHGVQHGLLVTELVRHLSRKSSMLTSPSGKVAPTPDVESGRVQRQSSAFSSAEGYDGGDPSLEGIDRAGTSMSPTVAAASTTSRQTVTE